MSAYRRSRRISELEQKIAANEARLKDLESEINDASAAGNATDVGRLGLHFEALRAEVDGLLEEWTSLG
jgi:cell division protein FtsL